MLVSVIIPTYNRAYLIKDAIDSVLNQSYHDIELLVIDDSSTDSTAEIVQSYNDERVKYLLNTRTKGAQGARNTGLYKARGEWIALLDSDDIWLPNKLKTQVDYVTNSENNVVGLSTGSAKYDFENQHILHYKIPQKKWHTTEDLLYKNYLSGFSTFFFKKKIALQFSGFDERLPAMQDLDFYISMSKIGRVDSIPEVLTYIREDNDDRITKNHSLKLDASYIFYQKYKMHLKKSILLENKAISRLLAYGWKNNKIKSLRYFHWLFLSLIIDRSNLRWILSNMLRK
ncbi:MAG: glycosyltransferase family A protein [Balneolales bacterium]